MKSREPLVLRLEVFWALFRRDLGMVFRHPAIYLIVGLVCLALAYFSNNFLLSLGKLGVSVAADPVRIPYVVSVVLITLYLAVASGMSLAQERENRTLEVFFYGPVTPVARVLALFLRDASVFLVCAASFLVLAFAAGGFTRLFPGSYTLSSVGLSICLVWPTLGLSLLASAAVRKTRTAVILVVGVFLVFAALQAAGALLAALPAEGLSLAALVARGSLMALLRVLEWLSPLGYLAHVNDAILATSPLATTGVLAAAAGYTALMLALSILVLARREKGA